MTLLKKAAFAFALGLTGASVASAETTIKLTAISGYGAQASWVRVFDEVWIPEVNRILAENTDYQISVNQAYGTVVKPRGEMDAVANGIADIGLVVPVFHADRVPLSVVSYVTPFATTDLGLNVKIMDQLASEFPEFNQSYQKFGQELLGHMGTIKSYALLSKDPVGNIADLKGKKVMGAGLNLRWLEGVGAVGITSALTSWYSDVDSGVGDAMLAWAEAVGSFKLCEVAPYFLDAEMGTATAFAVTANSKFWNDLPEEVRSAMRTATATYRDELALQSTAGDATGREECVKQGGQIVKLADQERSNWAAMLPPIAKEWADATEAVGLPGNSVLARYMELLREADQPIARDWDRE